MLDTNPKPKPIRFSRAYAKGADGDVVSRGQFVLAGVFNDPTHYPNAPVDQVSLKGALDGLSASMTNSLDGSKKALAEKKRLRALVIKMLNLLGHYVEAMCNNDMNVFLASGFEPLVVQRTPDGPMSPVTITKVEQGNVGQLLVTLEKVLKAYSYEIEFGAVINGAPPTAWTKVAVPLVGKPIPIGGLTAGTVYMFQAHALGKLGFGDFGAPVTKMST